MTDKNNKDIEINGVWILWALFIIGCIVAIAMNLPTNPVITSDNLINCDVDTYKPAMEGTDLKESTIAGMIKNDTICAFNMLYDSGNTFICAFDLVRYNYLEEGLIQENIEVDIGIKDIILKQEGVITCYYGGQQ